MKKLLSIAMLTSAFIAGCGGGGGDDNSNPSTGGGSTPPPQQVNAISATWFHEYPNQCIERYEFMSDGRFEIYSDNAFIAGTYDFDTTVEQGERHALTLIFDQQNQELDCEGSNFNVIGSSLELFADFSSFQMKWFETEQDQLALITLERAVSLSSENIPSHVASGTTVSFQLTPDVVTNDPITLLYGPSGMIVDNAGNVTWTPSIPMINREIEVNFAFSGERVITPLQRTITITQEDFVAPTMRKGIEVSYSSTGIQIANIMGDDANEIVVLDKSGVVSVVAPSTDGFESVYSYPYAFPGEYGDTQLALFDTNNDDVQEIFIGKSQYIYHVPDLSAPPIKLLEIEDVIYKFRLSNIDQDMAPELVIVTGEFFSTKTIYVYDNDFQTLLSEFSLPNAFDTEIVVANVDSDSSLEIITSPGVVYDIDSESIQWAHDQEFGMVLTTGDVNGDGIAEVLSAPAGKSLRIWDVENTTQIAAKASNDNCTITTANLDDDPELEIIMGSCQWGEMRAFDFSDDIIKEMWSFDLIDHGSAALTSGDIDNDGDPELVWGSGTYTTGEDMLVIAELSPTPEVRWYNENPAQLDSFNVAGWANTAPSNSAAVFVVPQTDSGYAGQRFAILGTDGKVSVSEEISTNWANFGTGLIGNINGDEYDELFLLGADFYDSRIDVIEIGSGNILRSIVGNESFDNVDISSMAVSDVNEDGFDDLIYSKGALVTFYDLENNTVVSTWDAGTEVRAVAASTNSAGENVFIVDTYNRTLILEYSNGSLSLKANTHGEIFYACNEVLTRPQNDTFVCLSADFENNSITSLSLDGRVLSNIVFDDNTTGAIRDAVMDDVSGNLYVIMQKQYDDFGVSTSNLAEIDSETGTVIWESTEIPGQAHKESIAIRKRENDRPSLIIATSAGMFLTH